MQITNDIKESHQRLSTAASQFLDYVAENPETLKRSRFKLLEIYDDTVVLQCWPTFINHTFKEKCETAATSLFRLIREIPQRIFQSNHAGMAAYYELPEERIRYFMDGVDQKHLDRLVTRTDFIFSPSGLKCLEFNVSPNLGGYQLPIWESLYLNTPLISQFMKKHNVKSRNKNLLTVFLEHLIEAALSYGPAQAGKLNIVIIRQGIAENEKNPYMLYLNNLYKQLLANKYRSRKLSGQVYMCDYPHLESRTDGLYLKNNRIDTLIETTSGNVPPGILETFTSGNLCLLNGPVGILMSNKLNLALLSENLGTGIFTPGEEEIIRDYTPWARKVKPGPTSFHGNSIQLETFLLSNREQFVLKPADGYGGKDISVGRKSTETEWKEAVDRALDEKNWLVQEYVESYPAIFQKGEDSYAVCDMIWGFFVFGSRYPGMMIRVMDKDDNRGVVNCHQGATLGAVFEVDR